MLAEALVAISITAAPISISSTVVPMETAPLTPACAAVGGYLTAWQERLELRDWTVGYYCRPDPDLGDEAEGTASLSQEERATLIYVHPSAPDQEEVAAHELVHVLLGFIRAADSQLVEEQAVRTLTRLLIAGKRCTPRLVP